MKSLAIGYGFDQNRAESVFCRRYDAGVKQKPATDDGSYFGSSYCDLPTATDRSGFLWLGHALAEPEGAREF